MTNDPFGGSPFPEWNPPGDVASGNAGSMTPQSQANAAMQPPKSSGNPFADVLSHVSAFNTITKPKSAPSRGGQTPPIFSPMMPPQISAMPMAGQARPPAPQDVGWPDMSGRTPPMTATGPNGHRIGSHDGGTTWFDVQTGARMN